MRLDVVVANASPAQRAVPVRDVTGRLERPLPARGARRRVLPAPLVAQDALAEGLSGLAVRRGVGWAGWAYVNARGVGEGVHGAGRAVGVLGRAFGLAGRTLGAGAGRGELCWVYVPDCRDVLPSLFVSGLGIIPVVIGNLLDRDPT